MASTTKTGTRNRDTAAELERLRREVQDLQIELQTSNEHGDFCQEHLYRLSASLRAEVCERQAAEARLQTIVGAITREKGDLEIMLQILMEEGDRSADEGQKAHIDGLTQIANRRRFDEFLAQEWERRIASPQAFSLMICDVDHFKLYNDHYGHQAGDQCLQAVAKTISSCFRAEDLVARYGGEEFAVVMPRTNLETAVQRANHVRVAIRNSAMAHLASPVGAYVTVSVGVACAAAGSPMPTSAHALLAIADQNLYSAKLNGRNRVESSAPVREPSEIERKKV